MKKLGSLLLLFMMVFLVSCEKEEYTVTFYISDSDIREVIVEEGEVVDEPSVLLEGYDLVGWYSDSTMNVVYDFSREVVGNLSIYAKLDAKMFEVKVLGYEDEIILVDDYEYGTNIADILPSNLTMSGYELLAYSVDSGIVESDLVITTTWELASYTVTFYDIDNVVISSETYEYGTVLGDISPTMSDVEGFVFLGWEEDINQVISSDLDVYPNYVEEMSGVINIGLLGPLSDIFSYYGTEVLLGAQIAIEEINNNGGVLGVDLVLYTGDTQSNTSNVLDAYNTLMSTADIDVLIAGVFSSTSLILRDIVAELGIPTITPTGMNTEITIGVDNYFRMCATDHLNGQAAATFASTNLNASEVAIVYNQNVDYLRALSEGFMDYFDQDANLTYEVFNYDYLEINLTDIFNEISALGYDVVYLPGWTNEISDILSTTDIPSNITIIGSDGWDGMSETNPTDSNNYYYLNHYSVNDPSETVQ